jgi:hypothetical protein
MSGTNSNNPVYVPTSGLSILSLAASGWVPQSYVFTPISPAASAYSPIDPQILNAASLNLQATINESLATVGNQEQSEFGTMASLFGTWANNTNNAVIQAQNTAAAAVSKSAKACSGFISCLF